MFRFFSTLFSIVGSFTWAPHKAATKDRVLQHRLIYALAAALVCVGLWALQALARTHPDPTVEPLLWTLATLSQLALTKLPLLVVAVGLVVLAFPVLWRWFFSTVAARNSVQYHKNDRLEVKAQKTLGAAIIQAVLLLGLFLVVGSALFTVR